MSSVGPKPCTVGTENSTDTGSGTGAWTNPGNIVADDTSYAIAALTSININSHYLRATGFDFSAVPSGATITGVQVTIKAKNSAVSRTVVDLHLYLLKVSLQTGTDQTVGSSWATNSDATNTYGADGNLWGATLSDTDVKDSGFGFEVVFHANVPVSQFFNVNYVTMTVFYTAGGGGGTVTSPAFAILLQGGGSF